jgi:UDP-GlcNAc:undecaprenyl-phosphate GlcNAc-1-phosphate transferase
LFYIRRAAARWGLMDVPGARKGHAMPTPLGGGLAMWLGVCMPLAIGQVILWWIARGTIPLSMLPELAQLHSQGLLEQSGKLWILLAAATAMMLLGLADDLRGLSWQLRLGVQSAVAALLAWQGWRVTLFLDVGWLTVLLSMVWIVAMTNAFNMLDNMDGLAAGVALIAAVILAAVVLVAPSSEAHGPQLFVGGFLLVLSGSLAGFLWHNHPPARIFMGDAGSYFIGFCLAAATISGSFAGSGLPRHAILAPLCALAVPIYDTLSVVVIRWREGRSPFVADNSHFSHRLVAMGLSKKQAVWTIYLATGTCGLAALVMHQVNRFGAFVLVALVVCVLTMVAILEFVGQKGPANHANERE